MSELKQNALKLQAADHSLYIKQLMRNNITNIMMFCKQNDLKNEGNIKLDKFYKVISKLHIPSYIMSDHDFNELVR